MISFFVAAMAFVLVLMAVYFFPSSGPTWHSWNEEPRHDYQDVVFVHGMRD